MLNVVVDEPLIIDALNVSVQVVYVVAFRSGAVVITTGASIAREEDCRFTLNKDMPLLLVAWTSCRVLLPRTLYPDGTVTIVTL